ncbi:hypothetical protein PGTUg99_020936 [Puccinia graminis f. sp. tritici]|uniref:Uncharacterized protein n=1 Tax=Puccinia graminis f. sp. tritici TaxID=56615 RepID=A0A5B0RFP8_PUCGR|nr:hypothetical protein PGTUg99_020936 [Puccinia graminis f. sp. tritici]
MPPLFHGQKSPRNLTRGLRPSPAPYRSRANPTQVPLSLPTSPGPPTRAGTAPMIADHLIEPMLRPLTSEPAGSEDPSLSDSDSTSETEGGAPLTNQRTKNFVGRLELPQDTLHIAGELGQMPAPQREATIFLAVASVMDRLTRIEATLAANPRLPTVAAASNAYNGPGPQVNARGDFLFGNSAKEFFRASARRLMLEHDIEAYSSGASVLSPSPGRSILTLVIDKLNDKDAAWRLQHMPPGYLKQDQWAELQVLKAVKSQVKHVRNKARDVILSGVCPIGKSQDNRIPCIHKLSRYLWKHLTGYKGSMSDEQIDEKITSQQRVRFAYLRLATIENYMDPNCRNVSQWETIDSQLEGNRHQIVDYTNVWHKLIAERDHEIFDQEPTSEDADLSYSLCPTHEEVLEKLNMTSPL